MIRKMGLVLLAGTALQVASPAFAEGNKPLLDLADKERWIVRARVINVDPDESSTVVGLAADVTAEDAYTPELDFTYFFTDNIAAELILATSQHDMGTNTGIDLGDVWVLPPTLTLQYHLNPQGQIRPYVGSGIGYILYYGENKGTVNSIEYEDGESYALQVGTDVGIDDHWAVNFDLKKLYHNTDVSINGGAIRADVDLNPWVFGTGVSYRF